MAALWKTPPHLITTKSHSPNALVLYLAIHPLR